MKQSIIGAIGAGIALFFWGFLYWGLNPLPYGAWSQPTDDAALGESLKQYLPETGTYYVPGPHLDDAEADRLHKAGPVAFIFFTREGMDMMDPKIMGLGLVHGTIFAFLLALLLAKAGPAVASYAAGVKFCLYSRGRCRVFHPFWGRNLVAHGLGLEISHLPLHRHRVLGYRRGADEIRRPQSLIAADETLDRVTATSVRWPLVPWGICMRASIATFLSLLVCVASAFSQQIDTQILGNIQDPSGAAVRNAAVTTTNTDTGASRTATTGTRGLYAFPALTPGGYSISVSAPGFKRSIREGLQLSIGEQLRADIALELGAQSDEITINAEPPVLNVESAAVGNVIPNNFIVNLPLNGRNFLQLALLVPGSTTAAVGSPGTERGRFAFQSNGSRESANSFLYDGVYAVDPILNSFSFTPPVDAVHEFRIQTSNSEAGLGRNSGGQIAVATKQGTNTVHGTVYEFVRNDRLDARNFFSRPDDPAPALRRNQFGFSLGGPIARNSTFFFADYEGLREDRAVTRTTNVPTLAERSGDFSSSPGQAPINFFTGQPFSNGQLPFFHPIGQGVAGLYPTPNRSAQGQNFVDAPLGDDTSNKFDIRLDQRVGERGQLAGRYSFSDRDRFEPFAAQQFAAVPGYGNDVLERGQNVMLSETHSFGSNWINEARFGFNRIGNQTLHQNRGNSINRTVGLPDFADRDRDLGLSLIQVTGFSPLGGERNNPQESDVDAYQFTDTVSYSKGRHLVHVGFEHRWIGQDGFRDVLSRGEMSFTDRAFTQNALADLLLGLPSFTLAARSDSLQAARTGATNAFATDSWRVSRDLTISLGLRYEYNRPAFDANDAASVYDPATFSIVQLGTAGISRSGYSSDKNNLAPRIGLAWRPGGTDRLVIRSGWGLYYNFSDLATGQGIYFNPPFFNSLLFFPSQQAPLSIENPWPEGQAVPLPPSLATYDANLRTSYSQQWNFSIQTELSSEAVLTVGYNGSRGTKLIGARDINQPAPGLAQPNFRPLPQFSDINQIASAFDSTYHSLQTQLQCRFRGGLTGLFSYTWSKSLDNTSNFFPSAGDASFPQDSNNVGAERGRSSFDTPHRFVGSFAYQLPIGTGKHWLGGVAGGAAKLINGWQINSIMSMQSGQPYTPYLPGDFDNSNTGRSIFGFGAGDRPNVVGNPNLSSPDPQQWFNPGAFALPAFGSFGNAGRSVIKGPGLANVDFSLLKDTQITEGATLQFRAEFFNLLNTPNFMNPNIFFATPGFGRILAARDGREVQFGIKLIF